MVILENIKRISKLRSLNSLYLSTCNVYEVGNIKNDHMEQISLMGSLTSLALWICDPRYNFTPGFRYIGSMKQLLRLELRTELACIDNVLLRDEAVKSLVYLPNLKHLSLVRNPIVSA